MSQLLTEIQEQPEVLRQLIAGESANIQEIARRIAQCDLHLVLIAARGTSDNAATYCKYLWGCVNRLSVALAAPSLYTLYERPPKLSHTLVVGVSQSGMSPDIVAVVEDARQQGMPTLAITNAPDSRLARAAEFVIHCHAGEERSVAATKSYTAQLLAAALLSAALVDDAEMRAQIERVPDAMAATLALDATVAQMAERYCYAESIAVVGRGYGYATALEIALKLKELSYTSTTPYSSADFLHGPIAVVRRGFPVLLAAPAGRAYPAMVGLAAELAARQAEQIIISDQPEILAFAQRALRLPAALPEWLSPITTVVPGQLLGYHLALTRGLDPEHPRGLSKVTETR
jgi:glucosamine--fructose-6-phosphate aminotransferase (isomerizing)